MRVKQCLEIDCAVYQRAEFKEFEACAVAAVFGVLVRPAALNQGLQSAVGVTSGQAQFRCHIGHPRAFGQASEKLQNMKSFSEGGVH